MLGSYAKLIKPKTSEEDMPLFKWTVMVYLAGSPSTDLSPIIERVDFILHKSFENVCTELPCVKVPCSITARSRSRHSI